MANPQTKFGVNIHQVPLGIICNAHGLSGLVNGTSLAGSLRANPSTKGIRKVFTSRIFIHPTAQAKLNQEFGIMKDEWKNIYYLPYRCSMEVSMRIVQYKINMDCLMTNVKLSKIKIINSDACSFCSKFPETMKHLFFHCKYTQPIWKQFENWWKGLSQEETTLNFKSILFGQNTDQPDLLFNLCILLTKKMIFRSRFNQQRPNFHSVVNLVKFNFELERKIATSSNTMHN